MLDYTQQKKNFLSVKLIDETQLFLSVPRKELYSKLVSIEKRMKDMTDIEDAYDEITQLTADILSNNKAKIEYDAIAVNELMDIEDMALLITEYSKYAGQAIKSPN